MSHRKSLARSRNAYPRRNPPYDPEAAIENNMFLLGGFAFGTFIGGVLGYHFGKKAITPAPTPNDT